MKGRKLWVAVCAAAVLLLDGTAGAALLHVSPGAGTIQATIERARPGDTILIHAGIYRESVRVNRDGITITAAPGESVVITGADIIAESTWRKSPDKPVWWHTPWTYHSVTHPDDEEHRLIGRTEQVIADGKLLKQVDSLDRMEDGTFFANPAAEALFIRLARGEAVAGHRIEASVRPVLMTVDANHVVIRGLRFLYASNPAQQAAFEVKGSNNLVEDCTVERTNGVGAGVAGEGNTMRRVVSRFNGQLGMSGHGTNLMEDCTLEGNNVKGFSKGWEAGGIKITQSNRFRVVNCRAIRNEGPGFWFDIDNREELVEGSTAEENNGPGIFIEISETATVRNNVCTRNGLKDEPGAWGHAGILLGEAMHCTIERNICTANRVGIEVRQQRVRTLPGKQYYSDGHVFKENVAAFNLEWQFALVGDNPFFGGKGEVSARELELLNPDKRGWRSESNVYFARDGEGLVLWGAKWLPKHQEYSDLKRFAAEHRLDATSIAVH